MEAPAAGTRRKRPGPLKLKLFLRRSPVVDRPHEIGFDETGFWVKHRRVVYGMFDYQWTPELDGVELLFQGRKFGEICGPEEIQADLKEFGLPRRVCEVATIVLGTMLESLLQGLPEETRRDRVWTRLRMAGCEKFCPDARR